MYNAIDLILPFLCVLTDTGRTTLELLSDEIFVKLKLKMRINLMFTKKISRSTVHISYMCTLAGQRTYPN